MTSHTMTRKIKVQIQTNFDSALKSLRQALKAGGFDIISESDVRELLGQVSLHAHRTLFILDRDLALRAFNLAPESALLFPYRVSVEQVAENLVEIGMLDPVAVFDLIGSPYLKPAADELHNRLTKIVEALVE